MILNGLQEDIFNHLSYIYLWSEKLSKYIEDEKLYLQRNSITYNGMSHVAYLSLQAILGKYGIITPAILNDIKNNKPEEFNEIYRHIGIFYSATLNDAELSLTKEQFPSLTWSSLFISTISYFEYFLIKTCDNLSIERGIKLKITDLNGNGTYEKFKNFCIKVLDLHYNFDSKLWNNINNHKIVRNIMVHNNGFLDNEKKKNNINNFIKENNSFLEINNNSLVISKKYLEEVIYNIQDWVKEFFDELISRI